MAASLALGSLLSDDIDDHLLDPHWLELLDRPTTTTAEAAKAAARIDTAHIYSPLDAQPHTGSSEPAIPNYYDATPTSVPSATGTPPASSTEATAASATQYDDFVPASYANIFPLPTHVPLPSTAWSLLHSSSTTVLSLGCPQLDELLDGGLRPGVTELVGEAGAAKSQICFQLLLQVQLAPPPPAPTPRFPLSHYGLGGCGFFITTEGRPPMTRLQQMQEAMHRRSQHTAEHDFLANVFMQEAHTVDQLLSIVEQLCADRTKVREQQLRLLIIDSVAGLFRVDDEVGSGNSAARADAQFRLSSALRRLSGVHSMVVVACNQVTDRFLPAEPILRSSETYRDRYTIHTSGRQVMPALGLSWANCVDVRLAVSRRGGARGGAGGSGGMVLDGSEVLREMEVMFAPHLPRRSMKFVVDADGVRGKENSIQLRDGIDGGEEWLPSASKVEQPQQKIDRPAVSSSRAPLTPISVNVPVAARAAPTKNVR